MPIGHRLDVSNGSSTANDADALTLCSTASSNSAKLLAALVALISVTKSDFSVGGPSQTDLLPSLGGWLTKGDLASPHEPSLIRSIDGRTLTRAMGQATT